jgi:membrane protein DedA with SNARE-associated domain
MRGADLPVTAWQRLINSLRNGRALQVVAVALLVLAVLIVLAVLYGDLPEFFHGFNRVMRDFFRRNAFLPGFVALYVEESGIPLPAPGDVFVMYVGIHVPHHFAAWLAAWLGLILVVVLGATNLFFISRRLGHRLIGSSFAEYVHLNPERLAKAEAWFKRYGVLAIIFGRHIPGFRVPITVASAVFGVPYRVFAPSVAVSTAIWAGVMLTLGINIGPHLAVLLQAHGWVYFIWGGIVLLVIAGTYLRQRRRKAEARRGGRPGRPVESPSS